MPKDTLITPDRVYANLKAKGYKWYVFQFCNQPNTHTVRAWSSMAKLVER